MAQRNVQNPLVARKIPSHEIQNELKKRIRGGEWAKGTMIPSRRALADEFRVSVPTVHKAITNMISEGILMVDANRTFVFGDPDGPFQGPVVPPALRDAAEKAKESHLLHATGMVGLVGDLKPGHTSLLANSWQVVMLDEAEQVLRRHKLKTRFYDLYKGVGSYVSPEQLSGDFEAARRGRLIDAILAERPAALIIYESAFRGEIDQAIRRFRDAGIHTIATGSLASRYATINVTYDYADEGEQIGAHLISQGCRRILCFSPYDAAWVRDRLDGVRFAAAYAGLPDDAVIAWIDSPDVKTVHRNADANPDGTDFHCDLAYRYAKQRMSSGLDVDGVVASNDQVALGFITAAAERGMKAGEHFAIAGFDDKDYTRAMGLTTMHPPYASMGREAARAAASLLSGEESLSSIVLKSRLVIRESSLPHR